MAENRTFWKTVKPFLTDKTNKTSRITLIEEERVISQDHLIVKTFSEHFINIPVKNIDKNQEYESFDSSEDLVSSIIKKYQNHPSIKLIKTKNKSKTFRLRETNTDEIISKVYERCLYDQISNFFEDVFSKYQCGFRKGYSAQHCLLAMIEK